jgi:hypothetical protein
MSEPFQIDILRRKPIPNSQKGVIINIGRIDMKEINDEEIKPMKTIIKDRRKYSTIERSLILDKIRKQKGFKVNIEKITDKTKPSEEERIIIPVGEPHDLFIKVDKKTLKKKEIEEKAIKEDLEEDLEELKELKEKEDLEELKEKEDLEEDLEYLEELKEEKAIKEEIEEDLKDVEEEKAIKEELEELKEKESDEKNKPIIEKKKRGRKQKIVIYNDDLINIDLKTAKIKEQIISETLPKPSEKIIIKSPSYYMTNRKLYYQKLSQLFQPYRKEILSNESEISCEAKSDGQEFELLTHQKIVRDYLNLYTPYRGLLLYHGLGSGKCLRKGTPIMLSDGSIKKVEEIVPGELLMGDDSTPRTVLSIATGRDKMYDVIPIKGEKYTGNSEHILCLQASGFPKLSRNNHTANTNYNIQWLENNKFMSKTFTFNEAKKNEEEMKIAAQEFYKKILENPATNDNIYEVAIKDYLNLPKSTKSILKGYKVPIDFPEKELPMDPYMIGYWLGDGNSASAAITSQDSTVLYYFNKTLPSYELTLNYYDSYHYGITGNHKKNNNKFLTALKDLKMLNNKHIPMLYKCNSRENRLKLLAGLLDSDGCLTGKGFEFTQKNETLMDDVIYLARSLGFSCYKATKKTSWTYKGVKQEGTAFRIQINGNGIEEIPTLIPRKQASPRKQIKDALVTGIKVEYVNEDDYYGFTLDGNCRYVMGDFTVTHNTCSSIALAEGMKTDKRVFIMTPASLKMNFFSELKKCGDHLYKKNQYWEFVSIDGKPDYVGILAKALSLKPEYVRSRGGAWLINITKEANFTDKTAEEQKEIDDQLNEMIRAKYIDINYNGINQKGFQKIIDKYGSNPFDNSVVLVDEAHNFVSRIVNKLKKPKSLSYMLYDLLMNANNARIVFMTGTPIINYPNEIGILFNMLRGYIKTWNISINVKTTDKINTETILQMFDKANFRTYDYIEYSGNKLTITRNPFGFINTKKRGVVKGTIRKPKEVSGGTKKNKLIGKRNTKKYHSEYDKIVDKIVVNKDDSLEDYAEKAMRISEDPHYGGSNYLENYNGVKLDESGNISDEDFINTVTRILTNNNLEIIKGATELKKYKALPDDSESFINTFVDTDNDQVKEIDLLKKRVLGLTSYFRSAQEKLLPSFVRTKVDGQLGDIFHIIKCEMTSHQFDIYQEIRKVEAEQEKRNKVLKKKAKGLDEDMYKISSTYRIFSRSACNFAFPPEIDRPMPDKENKDISEDDLNGLTIKELEAKEDIEVELEGQDIVEEKVLNYQTRIVNALKKLAYNEESPREKEYLTKDSLGMYSPKFVKLLENIQSEENQGLHLVYSQFRTIEGIGIIKLILEANGYAEFKIERKGDSWDIVDDIKGKGKPKFVLYTGTETAEEKEIVRNIYNSNWGFVPPTIANKLKELHPNNFMGEIIKVFMITSSGAEGINLKNTRFVHIVEPYWNMVRPEQVIGRARRICSHQDLPEELRTVKVFLYLAVLTNEQQTSKDNIELRNRDVSRINGDTPVTTDETLFEIASLKDKINRQILIAVKETAMDCSLYSSKNKDEPLVCYGSTVKIDSNNFDSYPMLETDMGQAKELNLRKQQINAIKITYKGKDYALNESTKEIFDYDSYLQSNSAAILVGHLLIKNNKQEIVFI